MSTQPYHRSFIQSCQAGADAGSWLASLDQVVDEVVRPRAAAVDRDAVAPAEALEALRLIGAFGVQIPVAHGGLGFGNGVAAAVVVRVGRACASTAAILMFHYQVVNRTLAFGDSRRRDDDLAAMADGSMIAASAWTEPAPPGGRADKADVQTSLSPCDDGYVVDGTKTYCTGLLSASAVDVLVKAHGHGPTFVRVNTKSAGMEIAEIYSMLGLRGTGTGTFRLSAVPVADADVLGRLGSARELMRANHETPLNPGLIALGIADGAFRAAVEMCGGVKGETTRAAFAEAELALESAFSYTADLISRMSAEPASAYVLASKLKAHATAVAEALTRRLVQVSGSRGFLTDYPLERYLRDAQATALMGPTNSVCLSRVAAETLGS